MEYRQLGHSGLRLSRLILGTMTFGGSGQFKAVGDTDLEGARRQIDMALDAGVNVIDTADVYSDGASEEIVGRALSEGRRDRVLLASKARFPMGPGPNDAGLSRHHLIEACEASLRRLQTDTSTSTRCTNGTVRRPSKRRSARSTTSSAPARSATSAAPTSPAGRS
jgi:aryl-alcohol dehydrogenase-like predicted oxidoreductase